MGPPIAPADDTAALSKTCPECGRVFTKAAHLLRHRLTHDQTKPFSCSVCQKAFARPDALQRHVRTVHSSKRRRADDDEEESVGREPETDPSIAFDMDPDLANVSTRAELPTLPELAQTEPHPLASVPGPTHLPGLPEAPSVHQLFPLPTFAEAAASSSSQTLDDMIAGWLSQDGTALASENALATAFSDQAHMDFMMNDTFFAERMPLDNFPQAQCPTFAATSQSSSVRSQAPTLPRGRRPAMTADTWESGMSNPQLQDAAGSRPASPPPREITSPEEVVSELNVVAHSTPHQSQVIPSMKFLDACLHLYFRDFHPSFPVIHRPTFERDRTPPLLLLSMCSVGCMFDGRLQARDSGVWIYERLHHVIVVTRDAKMATEESRVAVMLSALLGQCFSFLYGQPKQMLTAESFHGSLCTKARRSGLAKQLRRNVIPNDLATLDPATLKRRWREWARHETLRRLTLGLTIHAAESTIYSGLSRLTFAQVSPTDDISDALFEANDAEAWRGLLLSQAAPSDPPEVFLPSAVLAQTIVNISKARELEDTPFASETRLPDFYDYMIALANDHGYQSAVDNPLNDAAPHSRALAVLWHYTCVARLAPMGLIQEAAGREGSPGNDSITDIQMWADTPRARLATLHCGHVLHHAADLHDRGLLIPRAIFHATLLLLCYLYFSPPPGDESVDIIQTVEWRRMGQLCDLPEAADPTAEEPLHGFVAHGMSAVLVKGFFDGREKTLDIVSLRSRSNRLLRRCTPWGIGETLGEILSKVWF